MEAKVTHQGVHRKARGFSCKEVVDAGLTCHQAVELNIKWDPNRRSSHKENVDMLKKAASTHKFAAKPQTKVAAPKKKA